MESGEVLVVVLVVVLPFLSVLTVFLISIRLFSEQENVVAAKAQ
jgi:hypothetical protein